MGLRLQFQLDKASPTLVRVSLGLSGGKVSFWVVAPPRCVLSHMGSASVIVPRSEVAYFDYQRAAEQESDSRPFDSQAVR